MHSRQLPEAFAPARAAKLATLLPTTKAWSGLGKNWQRPSSWHTFWAVPMPRPICSGLEV